MPGTQGLGQQAAGDPTEKKSGVPAGWEQRGKSSSIEFEKKKGVAGKEILRRENTKRDDISEPKKSDHLSIQTQN